MSTAVLLDSVGTTAAYRPGLALPHGSTAEGAGPRIDYDGGPPPMPTRGDSVNSATDPTTPGSSAPGGDAPRPVPAPVPGPPRPRTPRPTSTLALATGAERGRPDWGRVDDDGTVYVRTADGERQVGQWPDGDPGGGARASSPGSTTRSCFEVDLLEQRREVGARSPPRTPPRPSSRSGPAVADAQAVGDLAALDSGSRRSTALIGDAAREAPCGAGAQARPRRRPRRSAIAAEAERLADEQRLAGRRRPAAGAARRVEGAPPAGEVRRRRALAAVLHRAHDLHPAPQGALRRAQREARGRPRRSRRSWSRRPRRCRRRPSGVRPRAPTAT